MADVEPLRALHYDQDVAGPLQNLLSSPYDVLDAQQRAALLAASPYNAVTLDIPECPDGGDPYAHAAATLAAWRLQGVLTLDEEPALWALLQDYTGPDGRPRTRRGILGRVRITDHGAGRIRPHERTHPGPLEDRLRLTRATRTNLSPIFCLYGDPELRAWRALEPHTSGAPWGDATDEQGTRLRLWRVGDAKAIATATGALADAELLIADGHHRYETARAYADEIAGDGPHRHVLMCLVAAEDEGLEIFPTHRLVRGLAGDPAAQERLGSALEELFHVAPVDLADLRPPDGNGRLVLGYVDAHLRQGLRLTLKDEAVADAALADHPEPYRRLDAAVLEALVLRGALGMTEASIAHLDGLGYSRSDAEALQLVLDGTYDAAFLLRPATVEQVRAIAAAGETMPPKSTSFHPKVPTGLLFHPLR